jgi:hypothetical protein
MYGYSISLVPFFPELRDTRLARYRLSVKESENEFQLLFYDYLLGMVFLTITNYRLLNYINFFTACTQHQIM